MIHLSWLYGNSHVKWLAPTLVLLALLFSNKVLADLPPIPTYQHGGTGCAIYTMCDFEADLGICKRDAGAGDDEIVLNVTANSNMTFYSTNSGPLAYSCSVFTKVDCDDAGTCTAFLISATPLALATPVLELKNVLYDSVYVTCTVVTEPPRVDLLICPVSR